MSKRTSFLIVIAVVLSATAFLMAKKSSAPLEKNPPPVSQKAEKSNLRKSDDQYRAGRNAENAGSGDTEAKDIEVIKKYYRYLNEHKFRESYDMYADDQKTDFQKYQSWYGNLVSARPSGFQSIGEGTYEFNVYLQEKDQPQSSYEVVMMVKDEKIETIYSKKLPEDDIGAVGPPNDKFQGMEVTTRIKDKMNYVILIEDGNETMIDQAVVEYDDEYDNIGEVLFFYDPKFSPDGNFISYQAGGWEGGFIRVYSVKGKKQIIEESSLGTYGFTKDEKFIYGCLPPGMIGGAGVVYSLPDGKQLIDIYENSKYQNFGHIECEYDPSEHTVIFRLSEPYRENGAVNGPEKMTVRYDLKERRIR